MQDYYLCIDLKTFYASVECAIRGLDPFKTNLVVADPNRGKKSICLAITPALKKLGIKNRCRLFEIPPNVRYITAMPQMKKYIEYASNIYEIYLQYIDKEDIYSYSIDEMFLYVTPYLKMYKKTPIEFAQFLMNKIFEKLKLTAAAGVGTNLFLAKIALDITAKHTNSNIGFLTEEIYRKTLLNHMPITDFWQISNGIANRLEKYNAFTMSDILNLDEEVLYKEFGINAEILIDHARGIEPVTIKAIKAYIPKSNSISHSQVLCNDYDYKKTRLVLTEMVETLCLELSRKHLVSNHISLGVSYLNNSHKPSGVSMKISIRTNVFSKILPYFLELYDNTVVHDALIKKISIGFGRLLTEDYEYLDLFTEGEMVEKEKKLQNVINNLKDRFGKNTILKAMNLEEGATTIKRNKLIGGHNAEIEDECRTKS